MGKKIKTDARICVSCRYHMGFGSQPGKEQTEEGHNHNIACDYLDKAGHSRIFKNGKMRFSAEYCDKYEPGGTKTKAWNRDNMREWREEAEKEQLWKELEGYAKNH